MKWEAGGSSSCVHSGSIDGAVSTGQTGQGVWSYDFLSSRWDSIHHRHEDSSGSKANRRAHGLAEPHNCYPYFNGLTVNHSASYEIGASHLPRNNPLVARLPKDYVKTLRCALINIHKHDWLISIPTS